MLLKSWATSPVRYLFVWTGVGYTQTGQAKFGQGCGPGGGSTSMTSGDGNVGTLTFVSCRTCMAYKLVTLGKLKLVGHLAGQG
jgi:hypothetical protein